MRWSGRSNCEYYRFSSFYLSFQYRHLRKLNCSSFIMYAFNFLQTCVGFYLRWVNKNFVSHSVQTAGISSCFNLVSRSWTVTISVIYRVIVQTLLSKHPTEDWCHHRIRVCKCSEKHPSLGNYFLGLAIRKRRYLDLIFYAKSSSSTLFLIASDNSALV